MLMIGSKGKTRSLLQSTMFQSQSEEMILADYKRLLTELQLDQIQYAGAVFIDEKCQVDGEYRKKIEKYFNTEILRNLNFGDQAETARKINKWMENRTSSRIHRMFSPSHFNTSTNLVLASALHFKGNWQVGFDPQKTKSKDFFVSSHEVVEVKMMSMSSVFSYARLDKSFDCSMLEIPLSKGRLVMQILLPNKKDGIHQLEKKVSDKNVLSTFDKEKKWKKLTIYLPKLKTEVSISMSKYLKALGLSDLFSSDSDFSGISSSLSLSRVDQRISLEIGEEGDNVVGGTLDSHNPDEAEFLADHPFLFYIRDRQTGASILQGKISEPIITSSVID